MNGNRLSAVTVLTPSGCGWWLEYWKAGLSLSSGVSASPSSLESRPPSPAAVTELRGESSELGATAGVCAGGRGLEVEVMELPGALEKNQTEDTGVNDV